MSNGSGKPLHSNLQMSKPWCHCAIHIHSRKIKKERKPGVCFEGRNPKLFRSMASDLPLANRNSYWLRPPKRTPGTTSTCHLRNFKDGTYH